jgi:hypothetical protein
MRHPSGSQNAQCRSQKGFELRRNNPTYCWDMTPAEAGGGDRSQGTRNMKAGTKGLEDTNKGLQKSKGGFCIGGMGNVLPDVIGCLLGTMDDDGILSII